MTNETEASHEAWEDGDRTSLDQFLADLRERPLLTPERIAELAKEIRAQEQQFRKALYEIPGTAVLVLEDWNTRREAGRVTGLLSHHARDESTTNWSVFIDERLEALSELVAQRDAAGGPGAPGRRQLAAQTASVLASADIILEVLIEIALELRAYTDDASRPAAQRRRELGVSTARGRRALERAEQALELRNEARNTIASHNLRLVVHIAKRFRGRDVAFVDLIQEGCIGLLRAVDKFDADLGFKFSTYAVWWIEQAMIRAIQRGSRTVRVPSHVYEAQLKYRAAVQRLSALSGAPTRSEIADALDIDEGQLDLLVSSQRPIQSIDSPLDDADGLALGDRLADSDAPELADQADLARLRAVLHRGLGGLSNRERKVLCWRFGLKGHEELTLQQIGERLGVSRERARQIQNDGLAKLREQAQVSDLRPIVMPAATGSRADGL